LIAPLEIEVGTGNGRYLKRAAQERPGHLFLGLERSLSFARKTRDRMVKYGIGNARVIRGHAWQCLRDHILPESVHAVHVYFTDPWPKSKHAKRRIFQPDFLKTLHRILKPGSPVFIKVDLCWYFEEILGTFERSPLFNVTRCGSDEEVNKAVHEVTAYEQKGLNKRGRTFYLAAEKV
jgi:tRNA (guanine-N7-)-methyltransferase